MQKEFPFGIDPTGQVPDINRSVEIVIEPSEDSRGGRMNFDYPVEPIPVLVAQMKLMITGSTWGRVIVCNNIQKSEEITVTAWDPAKRVLTVGLSKGALPVTQPTW